MDDRRTPAIPPSTLRQAWRAEWSRVSHPPFETLVTVAVNGALMSSLWFFLPLNLRNEFFTIHNSLAFALVLSSWMYADVPATNVLGSDAKRVVAAIDDPWALGRILIAHNGVLWTLVAPICLVIAIIDATTASDPLVGLYSAVGIAVVPVGVLAISAWVGILFPYHPIPIRSRLQRRHQWRQLMLRWGALILTPYLVVPGLTFAVMAPSLLIWGFASKRGLHATLPDRDLGFGIAVACAISITAAVLGHRQSLRLIKRRRADLVVYLSDPLLG